MLDVVGTEVEADDVPGTLSRSMGIGDASATGVKVI